MRFADAALVLATFAPIATGEDTCVDGSCAFAKAVLTNGVAMPWVGQGLAGMKGDTTAAAVRSHVAHGFRSLDGAQAKEWYDDKAAGFALRALLDKTPGLVRSDFFIASKVHPAFLSRVEASVQEMFSSWRLSWATDTMDLVYLHYPECGDWIPDCHGQPRGNWRDAWRELERLYAGGKIRALGVSNFSYEQLQELWAMAQTPPHVVQMWMDPFHQAHLERSFVQSHGGVVVAYSSLGTQWQLPENPVLTHKTVVAIAAKRNVPAASVVLAYFLRIGVGVIPRSSTDEHIRSNARLLDPEYVAGLLDAVDMATLAALDGTRPE
ncbi:hypothetical protein ACHHYP_01673 [Achlya hypogyna]|uniref:Secreted protein n=1 Tax=Achlya hypogyna TaxID=1202772 RepID=A0A0A7CMU7_ACHHY|nr:secreted protein [Achlya hypogyna]OQR94181.1 hypothetical protein ACHHYP_01673 [Achlya hypogyna]